MIYLKNKILLGILIFLCLAFYIYSRWLHERELILNNINEVLLQAAQTVKYILPDNFHTEIKSSIPQNIDDRNIRKLTEFARERNIRFIYSFANTVTTNINYNKTNYKFITNVIFTASSINTNETFDNPEVRYGFVFSEASETVKEALKEKGVHVEEAEDRWGKFYAVYYTRIEGTNSWLGGAEYRKDLFDSKLINAIISAVIDLIYITLCIMIIIVPKYIRMKRQSEEDKKEIRNLRQFYKNISKIRGTDEND